jgi:hypothetical protein
MLGGFILLFPALLDGKHYTCFSGEQHEVANCSHACMADEPVCKAWQIVPFRANASDPRPVYECCLFYQAQEVRSGRDVVDGEREFSGFVTASDRIGWRASLPPLPSVHAGDATADEQWAAAAAGLNGSAWDLVLIVPIHPPKFPWLCNFFDASLGRGLPILIVFSTTGHRSWFKKGCPCGAQLKRPLVKSVVSPRWKKRANLPTVKKWWALDGLFTHTPARHALALDSDSQMIGEVAGFDARVRAYLHTREAQRTIMMKAQYSQLPLRPPGSPPIIGMAIESLYRVITRRSCAVVKLPPLAGYAWWSDVPIYDREDWPDFFARTGGVQSAFNDRLIFDWLAYACYKVYVRGWSTQVAHWIFLEYANCKQQREAAANHAFAWSTGNSSMCGADRLFQAHVDRPSPWQGERAAALRVRYARMTDLNELHAYCPPKSKAKRGER